MRWIATLFLLAAPLVAQMLLLELGYIPRHLEGLWTSLDAYEPPDALSPADRDSGTIWRMPGS